MNTVVLNCWDIHCNIHVCLKYLCLNIRHIQCKSSREALSVIEKEPEKKVEIVREFSLTISTLSAFLKNKEKSNLWKLNSTNRKGVRGLENSENDKWVYWNGSVKQSNSRHVSLCGLLITHTTKLGKTYFKSSTGWVDGYKERNIIILMWSPSWRVNLLKVIHITESHLSLIHISCLP